MTMQKVGYDGTYLMELANTSTPADVLERARNARAAVRTPAPVLTCMIVYIEDIAAHEGAAVRLRGWLHNRRSSGKIHFLTLRDGTGFMQCVMSKQAVGEEMFRRADHLSQESAIIVDGSRPRRRARTGRLRSRRHAPSRSSPKRRTTRSRRRSTASTSCSIGGTSGFARRGSCHPARPPRSHQRGPRLLQQPRVHPRGHADLHARRLRGHDDAVSRAVLRGHDRLPDAERTAVQRSQRHGARARVLPSGRPSAPRSPRRAAT